MILHPLIETIVHEILCQADQWKTRVRLINAIMRRHHAKKYLWLRNRHGIKVIEQTLYYVLSTCGYVIAVKDVFSGRRLCTLLLLMFTWFHCVCVCVRLCLCLYLCMCVCLRLPRHLFYLESYNPQNYSLADIIINIFSPLKLFSLLAHICFFHRGMELAYTKRIWPQGRSCILSLKFQKTGSCVIIFSRPCIKWNKLFFTKRGNIIHEIWLHVNFVFSNKYSKFIS